MSHRYFSDWLKIVGKKTVSKIKWMNTKEWDLFDKKKGNQT